MPRLCPNYAATIFAILLVFLSQLCPNYVRVLRQLCANYAPAMFRQVTELPLNPNPGFSPNPNLPHNSESNQEPDPHPW